MPRPTRGRTSLPGHTKAVKIATQKSKLDDDEDMMDFPAPEAGPSALSTLEAEAEQEEPAPTRPQTKMKKSDKLYAKREALLAKITAGQNPYSKSHQRRMKRAARPSENLNTTLNEVKDMLPEVEPVQEVSELGTVAQKKEKGAPGGPRLTSKKRQKVLSEEATRLPAVMGNKAFLANPFETIRLHTLNTLQTATHTKPPSKKKGH
ncbi:hypothetical protein T439DRAFT_329764 [Meredithblackwellia eburnea MCA 4105]